MWLLDSVHKVANTLEKTKQMTHVDFYFNATDLFQITQRLIAKALKAKANATVVVAGDAASLHGFDVHLWTFDATSFVPHVFASDTLASKTTVLLTAGNEDVPHSHYSLMINLGIAVPERFSRYERLIELVASDETSVLKGRERYTFYKQRGYPMSHLDLTKKG
jgi:DNA polymerase III subunit chi